MTDYCTPPPPLPPKKNNKKKNQLKQTTKQTNKQKHAVCFSFHVNSVNSLRLWIPEAGIDAGFVMQRLIRTRMKMHIRNLPFHRKGERLLNMRKLLFGAKCTQHR